MSSRHHREHPGRRCLPRRRGAFGGAGTRPARPSPTDEAQARSEGRRLEQRSWSAGHARIAMSEHSVGSSSATSFATLSRRRQRRRTARPDLRPRRSACRRRLLRRSPLPRRGVGRVRRVRVADAPATVPHQPTESASRKSCASRTRRRDSALQARAGYRGRTVRARLSRPAVCETSREHERASCRGDSCWFRRDRSSRSRACRG